MVSATPALALILGCKLLVDWLAAKGGPWGDTMGARCAICVAGVPAQIAFAALLSYAAFDWKPGMWTPAMMTLSFWLSMIAHYPLDEEKKPFLQHVRYTLVLALIMHLGIVGFIFAIVIPTRLLAKSDRPVLTLLTTGAAFPFLAFLLRKLWVRMAWKTSSSAPGLTPVQRMEFYARGVKIGSLMILLTPTVTLYFNTSIKYAIGSAMLQIVTEIAAKIVTAYMIKKQVFSHVKVAVIGPASKDAGDHQDGQQVGASKGREDDEEQRGDAESKKKRALAMIAVRWHAEIVAEKGSILAAALIAYLYFADLVDTDSTGLVLIGTVFFSAEALCDFIFVWVMDGHMDVPILRAVAYEPLLSKESVLGAVMLALTFVSMSGCIAMAASIEL
ncbi:hypothetical protein TeGR_g10272 [Tetraparma gracilis]|uniref:Uncharacterized protein n=1 Tax=Tetraparma gracilis TaxID=2962635 RepID=A0ABQ6M5I2_9STRA|nr:hypothetical protein TeGR_g10272 [Tetraparma gracilis]